MSNPCTTTEMIIFSNRDKYFGNLFLRFKVSYNCCLTIDKESESNKKIRINNSFEKFLEGWDGDFPLGF